MPPKRNTAGTIDGFLADSSGNAITTGTTTVLFKGSTGGATTGAWAAGTGTVLYKPTGGTWEYSYPAAEVNYDHTAFKFENAAAVSYLVNVYPTSVEAAYDGTGGVGLTLNRIIVAGAYEYEGTVHITNTAEEGKGIYVGAQGLSGVAFDLLANKQGIRASSVTDAGITAQSEAYYGLECMCGADYTKGIAGDLHGNVYGRVRGLSVHDITGCSGVGVWANSNGNAALATAASLSNVETIATNANANSADAKTAVDSLTTLAGNINSAVGTVQTSVTSLGTPAQASVWTATRGAYLDTLNGFNHAAMATAASLSSLATTVGAAGAGLTSVTLAATGLDAITTTAPTTVADTFPKMVVQLWRRFFKKATATTTQIKTYADNGTTVVTTQTVADDGTTQTQGAAS